MTIGIKTSKNTNVIKDVNEYATSNNQQCADGIEKLHPLATVKALYCHDTESSFSVDELKTIRLLELDLYESLITSNHIVFLNSFLKLRSLFGWEVAEQATRQAMTNAMNVQDIDLNTIKCYLLCLADVASLIVFEILDDYEDD